MDTRDCSSDELQCRNGNCINQRYRCDGDADCAEGEDEVNCDEQAFNLTKVCLPEEFTCRDRHFCIQRRWVCDGESDCPDGSDESVEECGERKECSRSEFACDSGECIPGPLQCSGVRDCRDGSDEINCGKSELI